jgi:zinc protease
MQECALPVNGVNVDECIRKYLYIIAVKGDPRMKHRPALFASPLFASPLFASLLFAALLFAFAPLSLSAQADVTGLKSFSLDNGLEVFILENHNVPLARVQITFRTGAISQTPQTAGLFHLYEHMLFKGNRTYPTQSALQAALKELGVGDWNGGTSAEDVSYYFTVPSDKTDKGIQFWADAVRFPLFDPAELDMEKNVVVNEILGYLSDPDNIYGSAVERAMFWKYPWRKDVSGSEALVRSATIPVLREMQNTWYVPNNAAIFVGGDVDPAGVRAAVQKYFGDWKKAKDPWLPPPPAHPAPQKDALLVLPDDQMYPGIISVSLQFRGPDVLADTGATYAADALGNLVSDPNGKFKADIFSKVPGQYRKESISEVYATQRDGGLIMFSTLMLISPQGDTFARLSALKTAFTAEMAAIASTPAFFSADNFNVMKRQLTDDRIWERETVNGFIGSLSFWWSSATTSYYLGYTDALQKVTQKDIAKYIADYILSKPGVMSIRMNPKDFEKEKAQALGQGWSVIAKDNAYWWTNQAREVTQ